MSTGEVSSAEGSVSSQELARQAQWFRQQLADGAFSASADDLVLDAARLDTVLLRIQQKTQALSKTQSVGESQDVEMLDPPPRIGRFAIDRIVGVGGFSIVYKAHDDVLLRDVALKSIRRRVKTVDVRDESRLHEARAAAQLSHPNLVPLYEVFQDAEAVYLVSELCLGSTLGDWLEAHPGPIDPRMACGTCFELTEAIIHVHDCGFVHRDIKPGNIMISESVGTDGRLKLTPRLTDFGLVRDIFADSGLVDSYRLVGTLLYMAPEQVLQNEQWHGKACDIFAIGILLYRMLTGKLPHQGDKAIELFHSICVEPPIPPRQLVPSIPRDLEAICLKCLAKDPALRYATASDLRDDLYRYQRGLMVEARPRSFAERTWVAIRRSPLESSLLATIIILLVAGTVVLGHSNRRLNENQSQLEVAFSEVIASEQRAVSARKQYREQRDLAKVTERQAVGTAYVSDLRHAYDALSHNNLVGALEISEAIEKYASGILPNGTDLNLLQTLARKNWTRLPGASTPIRQIAMFPDSLRFLVADEEGPIRIYRKSDGQLEHVIPQRDGTRRFAVAISPDGQLLAVGSQVLQDGDWLKADNQVEFVSLGERAVPPMIPDLPTTVESLAFSNDGSSLAVGCRYQSVRVVDVESGNLVQSVRSTRRNHEVIFSDDAEKLIVLKESTLVRWVDLKTNKKTREVISEGYVNRIAWSESAARLAACYLNDHEVTVTDLSSPRQSKFQLQHNSGLATCVAISDDGQRVVAGTQNGAVLKWDLSQLPDDGSSEQPTDLRWPAVDSAILHAGYVTEIAIDSQGRIISGAEDGSLVLSSFQNTPPPAIELDAETSCATLTPDGQTAFVGCHSGKVFVVDTTTHAVTRVIPKVSASRALDAVPRCLQVSPDGRWLGVGTVGGDLVVIDLHDPRASYRATNPDYDAQLDNYAKGIHFSPNGERVAFCTGNGYYLAYYALPHVSGELKLLSGQELAVRYQAITLLDDQRCLMFGDSIGEFVLGGSDATLVGRGMAKFVSACYAPEAGVIYSAAFDNRIRKHDLNGAMIETSARWNSPGRAVAQNFEVTALAVTPDGRNLLTGGSDGSIGIWNAQDLRNLGCVVAGDGLAPVSEIQFSHDGKTWIYCRNADSRSQLKAPFQINTID
ncbi:Serine/threonine-protein kinase PrkC [Rosistilla carotiformis]|uniref:Serine/threonine-protein kinase PrkC n=1 Tax=Rosistilla carotiformis TaxID=2528017 RepID=A0A518JV97_9BACT|nr:WD40 repeat domain-containing serine/threonine protein kinase [Rosistilla carotiformis]QDV69474.1 Serine/threonine-protein kinase PrkC [Rosistilla carotiformis]